MHKILQAAIKRILGDKILLALVVIGMLGIFVGAFCSGDDDEKKKAAAAMNEQPAAAPQAPQAQQQMQAQAPAQAPAAAPLDSGLATDFVKWWMTKAMDYQAATAHANHAEAFRWMTREAYVSFQQNYWTPQVESNVTSGQLTAAYQPISVQAEAMNPDGSIVIGVTGTLVIQANGNPYSNQIGTDFLVRRDANGLRISGVYNRPVATAAAPAASPY